MEIESIKEIVSSIQQPVILPRERDKQGVLLPEGWKAEDISKLLPPPPRIQQKVEMLTVQSLIDYALRFSSPETVIFANEGDGTYDVVLDYHTALSQRGDCDHTARYACPVSDQWKAWANGNGKPANQLDFARFIETNLVDITRPVSADMLQIVLNLQVHKTAEFKGDIRLDNGGTKLSYDETVRGTTNVGHLVIPDTFQIGIPVFIDGPRYPIEARLRYRLDEGKLWIWYELVRPLDVYRAAIKAVSEEIRKGVGVPFWVGKR